ncbi:uncharacterized protein LOC132804574 [Ziziphus jujuba]|uniref:Uncharacterized protein LOC132804574 n=1 Tax=Ziziphus jujuba TaxID=326968 RepID=A0ABM4AEW4_ZIZJJ|nr:uncharacterized protein LOC132804574 [Ziziphus jujuba]
MGRLEVSQGILNTRNRQEFHGGRGQGRGGRERQIEEFDEEPFGGDFEEGMDETFAVQERAGHGRYRREETDDHLSNIKINIPPFMGKSDLEAYLEWEEKMEMIFDCHNYSEAKKVKLAAMEFGRYTLQWWTNEQNTRRRVGDDLITTWRQMKGAMRKRFVPSHYHRLLHQRLQSLSQGHGFVEDYYKEMEMLMMRLNLNEDREATMERFLGGLNREIANQLELQQYVELEEMLHVVIKLEHQFKRRGVRSWFEVFPTVEGPILVAGGTIPSMKASQSRKSKKKVQIGQGRRLEPNLSKH